MEPLPPSCLPSFLQPALGLGELGFEVRGRHGGREHAEGAFRGALLALLGLRGHCVGRWASVVLYV